MSRNQFHNFLLLKMHYFLERTRQILTPSNVSAARCRLLFRLFGIKSFADTIRARYYSLVFFFSNVVSYRNWPRYGLRWSGWYCNPAQHELCRPSRGRLRPRRPAQRVCRHNECCAGLQYQPLQRIPYKCSISSLPRSQFYKKQGKLAYSSRSTFV